MLQQYFKISHKCFLIHFSQFVSHENPVILCYITYAKAIALLEKYNTCSPASKQSLPIH
jgi:hypothetical protein